MGAQPIWLRERDPDLAYVVQFDAFLDDPGAARALADAAAFAPPPDPKRYISHNAAIPEPLLVEVLEKLQPVIRELLGAQEVSLRAHYRSKMAKLFDGRVRPGYCHTDSVPRTPGVGFVDYLRGAGLEADETNFAPGQSWFDMRPAQFNWTFVVYLSDPGEATDQGTGLWRHKPTGHAYPRRGQEYKVFHKPDWELIYRVPMAFNRAVLLPSWQYHGPPAQLADVFTAGPAQARLTLNPKLVSKVVRA